MVRQKRNVPIGTCSISAAWVIVRIGGYFSAHGPLEKLVVISSAESFTHPSFLLAVMINLLALHLLAATSVVSRIEPTPLMV
jgi:hypothetical protein